MKTTTYEAAGWHASVEKDDYSEGCTGGGWAKAGDQSFSAHNLPALLAMLADFVGARVEDADLDSCDEAGRVDFGVTENDDGRPASEAEIAEWKAGRKTLYYTVYTFHVYRVERERVTLNQEQNA